MKIKTSKFMSPENPKGLLRKVWFFIALYWCRRVWEGQRRLTRNSFTFATMIREATALL